MSIARQRTESGSSPVVSAIISSIDFAGSVLSLFSSFHRALSCRRSALRRCLFLRRNSSSISRCGGEKSCAKAVQSHPEGFCMRCVLRAFRRSFSFWRTTSEPYTRTNFCADACSIPSSSHCAKTETQKSSETTASCETDSASVVRFEATADEVPPSASHSPAIASSVCFVSVVFKLVCVVVCVTRTREEMP